MNNKRETGGNNMSIQAKIWIRALCISCCIMFIIGITPIASETYASTSQKINKSSNRKLSTGKKQIAVIIDDLGNGMEGTEEIMALPIKITVAVMPFLRTTERDAKLAHKRGFDVLVHLPMEPKRGNPKWLGPGAITSDLSNEEVRTRVEEAIKNVPYAVGINNHMGSKVTSDERIMSIVLEVCREHGLFFVDSRTNYRSIVPKLCAQKGMPQVLNHIFLDDVFTVDHVTKQLHKVSEHLKEYDRCVTIGHVGKQGKKTAEALKRSIPQLEQEADFVRISEMVQSMEGPSTGPGFMLP